MFSVGVDEAWESNGKGCQVRNSGLLFPLPVFCYEMLADNGSESGCTSNIQLRGEVKGWCSADELVVGLVLTTSWHCPGVCTGMGPVPCLVCATGASDMLRQLERQK